MCFNAFEHFYVEVLYRMYHGYFSGLGRVFELMVISLAFNFLPPILLKSFNDLPGAVTLSHVPTPFQQQKYNTCNIYVSSGIPIRWKGFLLRCLAC